MLKNKIGHSITKISDKNEYVTEINFVDEQIYN